MGPLEGIRVIDLSAVVSGPLTGALMADQGAEVVKVERTTGDLQRNIGSRRNGFSGMFHVLNRGKRSIAINLQSSEGIEVVKTLARNAVGIWYGRSDGGLSGKWRDRQYLSHPCIEGSHFNWPLNDISTTEEYQELKQHEVHKTGQDRPHRIPNLFRLHVDR